MTVYAESSAVLSWLLQERPGVHVGKLLAKADHVVASDLTLIECERTLICAVALGRLEETASRACATDLVALAANWQLLPISREVADWARRPFPVEPLRTLDAIHVASALVARSSLPQLEMLTLDEKIMAAARHLGFKILPP